MGIHFKTYLLRPDDLKHAFIALPREGQGRNMKLQVVAVFYLAEGQCGHQVCRPVFAVKGEDADQFMDKIYVQKIDLII